MSWCRRVGALIDVAVPPGRRADRRRGTDLVGASIRSAEPSRSTRELARGAPPSLACGKRYHTIG
jgi:hypothetical protein